MFMHQSRRLLTTCMHSMKMTEKPSAVTQVRERGSPTTSRSSDNAARGLH